MTGILSAQFSQIADRLPDFVEKGGLPSLSVVLYVLTSNV